MNQRVCVRGEGGMVYKFSGRVGDRMGYTCGSIDYACIYSDVIEKYDRIYSVCVCMCVCVCVCVLLVCVLGERSSREIGEIGCGVLCDRLCVVRA